MTLGCLWAFLAGRAIGQQPAPLPVEKLLDIREFGTFSPVQFSPDGKWVLYTARDNRKNSMGDISRSVISGVPPYAQGQDICVVNADTHESRSLTGDRDA